MPFKVADYLQQYTAWRPPTGSNYLVPHFNASLKILFFISLGAPLLAAPLWTPCTSRDVLVKFSLLQLTKPIDIYTLIWLWACFDQVTLWNQIGYSHKEHPSDKSITYKDWNSRKVLVPFFSFRKSHQPLMWCRKVNLLSLRRNWSIFSKNCIFWNFVGILCRA